MSKPMKAMLRRELIRRLTGADSVVVVGLAGVDGVTTNRLRGDLRQGHPRDGGPERHCQAGAERGGPGVRLRPADRALHLATGPDRSDAAVLIVRELLGQAKEVPAMVVRGALMEGEAFGPDRIKALGDYPTREEALSNLVAQVLSPAGQLVGSARGPGGAWRASSRPSKTGPKAAQTEADLIGCGLVPMRRD